MNIAGTQREQGGARRGVGGGMDTSFAIFAGLTVGSCDSAP